MLSRHRHLPRPVCESSFWTSKDAYETSHNRTTTTTFIDRPPNAVELSPPPRQTTLPLDSASSLRSLTHLSTPSPPHSFIPSLHPSFSAHPSHRSLPFLLPDGLHGFSGLFTDTSDHIRFYALVFFRFSTFSWFRAADLADSCQLLSAS